MPKSRKNKRKLTVKHIKATEALYANKEKHYNERMEAAGGADLKPYPVPVAIKKIILKRGSLNV